MSADPVDDAEHAVAQAFREEWGQVVGTLVRRFGDWELAEECAQEAFAEALTRWPDDGVPRRPGGWLTTVARNRALDRLRREARGAELLEQVGASPEAEEVDAVEEHDVEDERLRLIFTCCHPALPLEGRVALTLRTLGGLSTAEVARAFLVPEATMAKRLTRTKAKIAAAGIPYRVPSADVLPERTAGVLAVLYLLFTQGYVGRPAPLCDEAIRLARALHDLLPDDDEVAAALALMLLTDARRAARTAPDGALVPLEDQDRTRWDPARTDEGLALVAGLRSLGPYGVQAQVAACHARAVRADDTDWAAVAGWYAELERLAPSPVVTLSRAVAVGAAGDLDAALALVDSVADDDRLARSHLLPATRADLLRRRGRPGDDTAAASAYERAIELAPTPRERDFLVARLAEAQRARKT